MPEHVHLLIRPRGPDADIARIRQAIKEPVGRRAIKFLQEHFPEWIERLSRRRGKKVERLLWQSGGGYDRNITSAPALTAVVDYIHMNPVRRNFVAGPADWFWSSARWFENRDKSPVRLDPIPAEWLA
ncbi:MAG TPA: hypothetical protein VHZ24_04475 [Pirellulales bacterium]|nr:hypothetical protein [Pirellulales bacterium]